MILQQRLYGQVEWKYRARSMRRAADVTLSPVLLVPVRGRGSLSLPMIGEGVYVSRKSWARYIDVVPVDPFMLGTREESLWVILRLG